MMVIFTEEERDLMGISLLHTRNYYLKLAESWKEVAGFEEKSSKLMQEADVMLGMYNALKKPCSPVKGGKPRPEGCTRQHEQDHH